DTNGHVAVTTTGLGGGVHSITACYTGTTPFTSSNGSTTQTVNKKGQTITFNTISDQVYSSGGHVTFFAQTDAVVDISDPNSAHLQLDFTSLTPSVCTIPSVHVGQADFVTTGLCKIVASQAGNDNYTAAADVERDFNIVPSADALDFNGDGGNNDY